jgi:hypothetical protein
MADKSNEECLKYWTECLELAIEMKDFDRASEISEIVKQYADWMKE